MTDLAIRVHYVNGLKAMRRWAATKAKRGTVPSWGDVLRYLALDLTGTLDIVVGDLPPIQLGCEEQGIVIHEFLLLLHRMVSEEMVGSSVWGIVPAYSRNLAVGEIILRRTRPSDELISMTIRKKDDVWFDVCKDIIVNWEAFQEEVTRENARYRRHVESVVRRIIRFPKGYNLELFGFYWGIGREMRFGTSV